MPWRNVCMHIINCIHADKHACIRTFMMHTYIHATHVHMHPYIYAYILTIGYIHTKIPIYIHVILHLIVNILDNLLTWMAAREGALRANRQPSRRGHTLVCLVIRPSGAPSTSAARGDDVKCPFHEKKFIQLPKISNDLFLVTHPKNETFNVTNCAFPVWPVPPLIFSSFVRFCWEMYHF